MTNTLLLGLLGLSPINESDLSRLALETLSIEPLRDILELCCIKPYIKPYPLPESYSPEEGFNFLKSLKDQFNLDMLAVIKKEFDSRNINNMVGLADMQNMIIYSTLNPRVLAHEIGHLFGLKHPCEPGYECMECSYMSDIMCADNGFGKGNYFSEKQKRKILDAADSFLASRWTGRLLKKD